ncbi:MAG: BBP7 family outer membrane beta-barrel protein [Candidatus Omnitrophica bacterium]|nr:BBP7 family outer membrane beta-barrel protein [Candidatus Omnitrophota bacterium]
MIIALAMPGIAGAAQSNTRDSSWSSHPPRWTVSAEAIVFDRVGTDSQTLVERIPGTEAFNSVKATAGTEALNSTDLKQGFCPGFRLGAAYHVDSNHDLLLSFFRISDWDSTKSVGPDNPLNWLVMRAPGGFFQTQDFSYQSMTWDYSAKLDNAEFNVQKKISSRITMLAGFRWLQLHENLQGTTPPADIFQPTWKSTNPEYTLNDVANITTGTSAPVYPPFWNTSTTNDLYGLQIGAGGKLFERGRFSIGGLIKIGGYWNHASESTGVSIAKVVYTADASTNHAAFVGDAALQCKYQITRQLTLKFGYQALWLDGVALAPGQIQETYSTYAPVAVTALGVNSDSNVLFHGATAGLELSF